jgi:hypothetical protein
MARYILFSMCSFLVLVLVNCGAALRRGTLIDKVYEPEETWVQMMPIVTAKTTSLIPIVHTDDEDWVFIIEEPPNVGKKSRQKRIYVSEDIFAHHQKGDWIEIDDLKNVRDKDKPSKSRKP